MGGLTLYLIEEGLRSTVALPLMGGVGILLGLVAFNIAKDCLQGAVDIKEEFVPEPSQPDPLVDTAVNLFSLFLEGFQEPPVVPKKKPVFRKSTDIVTNPEVKCGMVISDSQFK